MTTLTSSEAMVLDLMPEAPDFYLSRGVPPGMAPQIEAAVVDFMKTSHMPKGVDWNGFYQQTIEAIAARAVMNQPGGDLWLGIANGELWAYVLGHVGSDIDGRMSYTVTQAWVKEGQRGKPWVRDAWQKVRQRAQDCFAKHFIVISSRGHTAAYCRFLGKGFHPYAEILKAEL